MASTNRTQTNRGQEPDRRHGVYVISVAAEIAGVHPQTLRIYERKGLLDPARTVGGNRRYSEFDIDRLRRIAELTADGLNLAGVKRVLELEEELRALHGNIEQLRRDAKDAVDEVSRRHRRDLVPLSQSVVVWGSRPSIFDERR
jgi:MerR family transcriptional regulator, heat shock protein HspR